MFPRFNRPTRRRCVGRWLPRPVAPPLPVLSPGGKRETPTQARAAALGLKIGTFPTGMISPAIAAMKQALAAIAAGKSESEGALPAAEFRSALGYGDYEEAAKPFTL